MSNFWHAKSSLKEYIHSNKFRQIYNCHLYPFPIYWDTPKQRWTHKQSHGYYQFFIIFKILTVVVACMQWFVVKFYDIPIPLYLLPTLTVEIGGFFIALSFDLLTYLYGDEIAWSCNWAYAMEHSWLKDVSIGMHLL